MRHSKLRHRYGHAGPRRFVEYFLYADGVKMPSWYRSKKAAVEAARDLANRGYRVEVQRRTHSATDPYKRVNIKWGG